MDFIPYNSRNTLHKSKFGALKQGETVIFKVIMPRSFGVSRVDLVIKSDKGSYEQIPMKWLSMEGENEEWWALGYTAEEPDIYFYHFEYETVWGRSFIKHSGSCLGRISAGEEDWQLSVYSKDFTTPDWLKGGLFYQIFLTVSIFREQKKQAYPLTESSGMIYSVSRNGSLRLTEEY